MDQEMKNLLGEMRAEIAEMRAEMRAEMEGINTKIERIKDDTNNLNFRFRNIQEGTLAAFNERDEIESYQSTYLVSDPRGFNSKKVVAGRRF